MFLFEHVPASAAQPVGLAAGSQSCASFPPPGLHAARQSDETRLFMSTTQHTVPAGQLAAPLQVSSVGLFAPPPASGQPAPVAHRYEKSGGGFATGYTQQRSTGIAHVAVPHGSEVRLPPGPASAGAPPSWVDPFADESPVPTAPSFPMAPSAAPSPAPPSPTARSTALDPPQASQREAGPSEITVNHTSLFRRTFMVTPDESADSLPMSVSGSDRGGRYKKKSAATLGTCSPTNLEWET